MKKFSNNKYLFFVGTQKELIDLLSAGIGKTKKELTRFIRTARENKYIWDEFKCYGENITIYVTKNKMFFVCPKILSPLFE